MKIIERNNIKNLLIGFVILSFVWLGVSNTLFMHTHTFGDGRIIVHSHAHNDAAENESAGHEHSSREYQIITDLNTLLLISFVSSAIYIVFKFLRDINFVINSAELQLLPIKASGRAPPVY